MLTDFDWLSRNCLSQAVYSGDENRFLSKPAANLLSRIIKLYDECQSQRYAQIREGLSNYEAFLPGQGNGHNA
jgi:hypothetical protein